MCVRVCQGMSGNLGLTKTPVLRLKGLQTRNLKIRDPRNPTRLRVATARQASEANSNWETRNGENGKAQEWERGKPLCQQWVSGDCSAIRVLEGTSGYQKVPKIKSSHPDFLRLGFCIPAPF